MLKHAIKAEKYLNFKIPHRPNYQGNMSERKKVKKIFKKKQNPTTYTVGQ